MSGGESDDVYLGTAYPGAASVACLFLLVASGNCEGSLGLRVYQGSNCLLPF